MAALLMISQMGLLLENFGTHMKCPRCNEDFEIDSRIELTFTTYKKED